MHIPKEKINPMKNLEYFYAWGFLTKQSNIAAEDNMLSAMYSESIIYFQLQSLNNQFQKDN